MSEQEAENPYASPAQSDLNIDHMAEPPGDGPFYFEGDRIGGRTPLTFPGECIVCGHHAANNRRCVKRYRSRDRSRFPGGGKVSYSVCTKCGWWIDFWRISKWLTLVLFILASLGAAVVLVRFSGVDPTSPVKPFFNRLLLGSMLMEAFAFFAAAMTFSFQPLRLQGVKEEGNRTYVTLPNQTFKRILYKRTVAQQRRDETEE